MDFFKNKDGEVVIWQWPNWPLIGWAVYRILALFIENQPIKSGFETAGTALLAIWALMEIYSGASPFRRALGVIVLAFIVIGIFF